MIPKVIHYCWFGGNPLPPLAVKCIASWRKYLPDYEIREWNESNFDVNIVPYTREAYGAKKYAFVSDYPRFWVRYRYGGLYFDTDVEVLRPLDDIVARGPFMGCERDAVLQSGKDRMGATAPAVAPGLGLGVNPGLGLYRELLDMYAGLHFVNANGSLNQKTVVQYTTEVLCRHGLRNTSEVQECAGVWIYPKEYFCPIDYWTKVRKDTANTYTVHHYAASWHGKKEKLFQLVQKVFGRKVARACSEVWKRIGY